MAHSGPTRRFCLVLIRASRYDDDGYVIRWLRSGIPSNSLAVLHGLATDCATQRVLGDDTALEIHAFDETNTGLRTARIAALVEAADAGLVMLVGVQTNQFPRALDIAAPLRQRGLAVALGGFHVSGTVAMLPDRDADLQRALDLGISLFAGEAEGHLGDLLRDARDGRLQPLYNVLADPPELTGAPIPLLPPGRVRRTVGGTTSFDAGRGCPFQCSFCTIINVQGRRSRRRSPDDVERIVRTNLAEGIHRFFITDDNFSRNHDWEPILNRLIQIREGEGVPLSLTIQVDTLCHRIPNFIEKSGRAGVKRVFIGLESVSPANLVDANKRQNSLAEYRTMLLAWKQAKVSTTCGYILGFPQDTPATIRRDLEMIQRELPVDILEFFALTPIPGSADHRDLHASGAWMDPDLNRFDGVHAVSEHPLMTRAEWEQACQDAWATYYSDAHVATLLRRAIATGCSPGKLMFLAFWFRGCVAFEHLHPLECGVVRIKDRRERRPGLALEPAWRFFPREVLGGVLKYLRWGVLYLRLRLIYRRVRREANRFEYQDEALARVLPADAPRQVLPEVAG